MSRKLKVLHVEDREQDVGLLTRHLTRAGYELTSERVQTAETMRAALMEREWDVILCDYAMPQFDALKALAVMNEMKIDLPFIIISGTVGEVPAVEAMRAGAHDYLMKDNLVRLGAAIERELQEAENRRARKHAEEALKISEGELRALFNAITDSIVVLDSDGRYLKAAPSKPAPLYKSATELLGKTLHQLFPRDKADFLRAHVRQTLAESRIHRLEYELEIAGDTLWFEGSVSPITENSVMWVARDITERKRSEEEQARLHTEIDGQRQRLNNIVDNVPGVVWEAWGEPDAATQRIDFVSDYVETMLGYTVENWLSTSNFWLSIVHPDDREQAARVAAENFATGNAGTLQFRWMAKDGRPVWVESKHVVIKDDAGRPLGMRGVTTDISERKRAEEVQTRRAAHASYRADVSAALATSAVSLRDTLNACAQASVQHLGAAFARIWTFNSDENVLELQASAGLYTHIDGGHARVPVGKYKIGKIAEERTAHITNEVQTDPRVSDKEWVTREGMVAFAGYPLVLEERLLGVIALFSRAELAEDTIDALAAVADLISQGIERKRAESALRESEERYRDLVENAHDIIYSHDLQGNYTSVNKSVEQITGYTREEAVHLNFSQIIALEYLDKAKEMLARKLSGETVTAYELEVLAKDGRRIAVEVNSKLAFEDGRAVGVQGIARDITERKHLEEQLRQSQKMEAIGQLAGGVAHDFNNLLTAINGYSSLALQRMTDEGTIRGYLEEIKKAGERAANLTRQLLAFGRKQMLQPIALNLNDVISDLNKMLRRLIGENIRLTARFDPALKMIKADPGQIEQVIMNLAVNARDAMPHGGSLTIETANFEVDSDYAGSHIGVRPGSYVMLAVSDTGVGMDDQIKARIFEPFFTTKEKGKGTGLGLSTVYGIVKQSGGSVWVYSEAGKGTSFKIYLPVLVELARETKAAPVSDQAIPGGTETILLVEDEDVVRGLTQKILENAGYHVLAARGGEEALQMWSEKEPKIDLLLTDVVMPETSGKEVADRLSQLVPGIKVLFMSGYTDESIVHHGVLDSNVEFIQKPFTLFDLSRKVRQVLDSISESKGSI